MNTTMPDAKKCPQCGAALPAGALDGLCPACLLQQGAVDSGSEPAAKFVPPTTAELSRFFPQLEILELIGKGGMGAVYKARQKELDRFVAVKILPRGIGVSPSFAERFAREAKALAKLNHPNIVTIYDFGRADGLFYFVMEFVDGVNLRQLLHASRVAPREALAIVPQICDALQYAHDAGIVHRDIKPENILLDRQGRVKVADFGLAKLMGTTEPAAAETAAATPATTEAGQVMGTPQYMAPEQRENTSDVDHRADIYSLGVVFYQMLTGELPGKKLEPPSKKVVIDVRLDEVVLRALEKKPELRYQQVSDVKTLVETIATTPPQPKADNRRPETEADQKVAVSSRFSRTAIVGPFFSLLLRSLVDRCWQWSEALPRGFSLWHNLLALLHTKLDLFVLGTTILGWVAVAQIRRSAGKLRGLWLAVLDGLFFPLLALDGFIAGLIQAGFAAIGMKPGATMEKSGMLLIVLLVLLLVVALDVVIVWLVWRAVNKNMPPQVPNVGKTGTTDWRLWSPFQPPLVREICVHMTETEKREAMWRGLLFGIWNAGTFSGPFFCLFSLPDPINWIYAIVVFVVGLSFYPLLLKMQREFVCTTAWARQREIKPEQLKEHRPCSQWRCAVHNPLRETTDNRDGGWRCLFDGARRASLADAPVGKWHLMPRDGRQNFPATSAVPKGGVFRGQSWR